ncbi:MAG: putative transcriptional regulator, partial [Colwellia sp.]
STNGCLCFTVANDALHFTQGINKLLNPIGSFIY